MRIIGPIVLLACMAGVSAAQSTDAPATDATVNDAPVTDAPVTEPPAADTQVSEAARRQFDLLCGRGIEALTARQPDVALEALLEARKLALAERLGARPVREVEHAVTVAYLQQDRYDQAAPYVARSIARNPSERDEIYNLGVYDLKTKRELFRSVQNVSQFLSGQGDAVDEPMLILLGCCLDLAAESDRAQISEKHFSRAVATYKAALKRLEAKRDGQRLWGARWLSKEEAEKLDTDKRAIEAEMRKLQPALDKAESDVRRLRDQIRDQERRDASNGRLGRRTSLYDNLAAAQARLDQKQQEMRALRRQLPMPDFPKELSPVVPTRQAPKPPPADQAKDDAA